MNLAGKIALVTGADLKREPTPAEIADAAVYLCRAENVSGITLTVAGGGEVH